MPSTRTPAQTQSSSPPFALPTSGVQDHHLMDRKEDLASDDEMEYDDEAELSDSPSSRTSRSSPRPITPHIHPTSLDIPRTRTSPSVSPLSSPTSDSPFSLAHKAEKILGLTPGTLSHARACLENARDEVRRLADETPRTSFSSVPEALVAGPGVKEKMSRTKKTMSVLGLSSVGGKVPGVVIGAGGKEEELRRERRRRAADGVLYWQKEVGRLQAEETAVATAASMTVRTMKKGRR